MAFKMNKMIFGKGTGSAREAAKTHAKTNHVSINRGPEFYEGENPYGDLYVDKDDPLYWDKMHSDKDYISMDMTAGEEGNRGPGENIERYDDYGGKKNTNEKHENYPGVKDEGAGYNKFTLGQRNEQEKQDNQRFNRDLSKSISNYRSKLPISGDLQMDDESFENWKELTGRTGAESKLRESFENETTQALNIHNELKLAADAGYKPRGVDKLGINMDDGEYKLNEGKYDAHQENIDLRHQAKANRDAQETMDRANAYVEKHGGTVADFLRHKPHLRDNLQGIHSFGQVDVDTQDFFDDAMYEDMDKQEKKEYDAKKEKEKQEELQLQADIQANLPADETSDPELNNELTVEEKTSDTNLSDKPTVEIENDKKLEKETSGEEKEEYVPQTQQKEYVPQSRQFKSDDIPQKPSILGSESSENVDPVNEPPPPVDDPSGEPEYGTDEYYAQKKAKRSKMLGLTKRPLNIHGRI